MLVHQRVTLINHNEAVDLGVPHSQTSPTCGSCGHRPFHVIHPLQKSATWKMSSGNLGGTWEPSWWNIIRLNQTSRPSRSISLGFDWGGSAPKCLDFRLVNDHLVGGDRITFYDFPIILGMECHHPKWRTQSIIFQRARAQPPTSHLSPRLGTSWNVVWINGPWCRVSVLQIQKHEYDTCIYMYVCMYIYI